MFSRKQYIPDCRIFVIITRLIDIKPLFTVCKEKMLSNLRLQIRRQSNKNYSVIKNDRFA